ncbi:Membrane magnesium transporter 1 [Balamuthia mandrillaris]
MSSFANRLVFLLGLLIMANAAYSAIQYRNFLKVMETPEEPLPLDVRLQTLLAVAVCTIGAIQWAGHFKHIKTTSTAAQKCVFFLFSLSFSLNGVLNLLTTCRSYDMVHSRSDFMAFSHRRNPAQFI